MEKRDTKVGSGMQHGETRPNSRFRYATWRNEEVNAMASVLHRYLPKPLCIWAGGACSVEVNLSRKLKSRYGARNRFLEPSLELRSQATWAGGPVQQPYAYLVPSPHSGTKVTDTVLFIIVSEHCTGVLCVDYSQTVTPHKTAAP